MTFERDVTAESYSIEPSHRSHIVFKATDVPARRSEKIMQSLKGDLYYTRLRQLVMEGVANQRRISSKSAKSKSGEIDVEGSVRRVLEETGLKQSLANISSRLHEKGLASMPTSSCSSKSSVHLSMPPPQGMLTERVGAATSSSGSGSGNSSSDVASSSSSSSSSGSGSGEVFGPHKYACASPAYHASGETVESIREARLGWTQGIEEEVHAMTDESGRPFALLRPIGEMNTFLVDKEENEHSAGKEKAKLIGNDPSGELVKAAAAEVSKPVSSGGMRDDAPRFLFDSEDLLETAAGIVSGNIKPHACDRHVGMLKVAIATPTLSVLQRRYSELSPRYAQLGLDNWFEAMGNKLSVVRQDDGELVSTNGTIVDARRFLRRGITNSMRPNLWRLAFGLHPHSVPTEDRAFYRLRQACNQLDLLTDELYILDVRSTLDDHRYFVFEEELKEIMLCFSRDEDVRHKAMYCIHSPLLNLGMDEVAKAAQIEARLAFKARIVSQQNKEAISTVPLPPTTGGGMGSVHGPKGDLMDSELDEDGPPAIPDTPNLPRDGDSELNLVELNMGDVSGTLENSDYTDVAAPPAAVQPFLGLCSYFAPLCFVFRSSRPLQCGRAKEGGSGALYSVARAAYCQIWCRMNVLSSDPGTLLYVCKTFEDLLIACCPHLFLHLVNLGIQPLQVALPWIQLGFTTVLDIDEVLLLWDRLFGYMDTTLLAVLAAGIFVFKSEALMQCEAEAEAVSYLMECSSIKVITIIQLMLFKEVREQ